KERSELRKKRRQARGGNGTTKNAMTPIKSVKKTQVDSGKKKDVPSRPKHPNPVVEEPKKSGGSHKAQKRPNLSAETCAGEDEDVHMPGDKDKKKKRGTVSREDASDTKYLRIKEEKGAPKYAKDENTQLSCMQTIALDHTTAHHTLPRDPVSVAPQMAKSRPRTDHTVSSRRDTGGKPKPTKGTKRAVHGGSKEERTKEDKDGKPKNPKSRGARSRNSRANNRNLSAEEPTVEASDLKEKKEKMGVKDYFNFSKLVRNPGSISKASRNKKHHPPPSDTQKTERKSNRSSKKTMVDEPVKDVPTIPKAPGGRSISKKKPGGKSKE
ncbi:hypothetical protein PMAYCL1PPCAC_30189, partial [Pristionchus mayeri]